MTNRLLLAGQGHGFHLGGDQLPDILTVQGLLQQALQQGQPLLQAQVCILHVRQLQRCSLYACDLLLNDLFTVQQACVLTIKDESVGYGLNLLAMPQQAF